MWVLESRLRCTYRT